MNKRYELYKNAHKNNPNIKYVFYSNDIDKLEKCTKNLLRYEQYKDRKEYYLIELVDMKNAIKQCNRLITGFKCKSCNKKDKIKNFDDHIKKNHDHNELVRFYAIKKSITK